MSVTEVSIDRNGLFSSLMAQSSLFYGIGCIVCFPFISCYSKTQKVTYSEDEVTLSYDLGVCGNSERHVPMDRIQDVTLYANCCDKLVGVQNLGVQTAGGGGPQAEITIRAPENAAMLRDEIVRIRNARGGGDGVGGVETDGLLGRSTKNPVFGPANETLVEMKDSIARIEKLVGEGVGKM